MTANEWRFKMCVLARDEWRKNGDKYSGLCRLFADVIIENGFVLSDNENLNYYIAAFHRNYPFFHLFPEFLNVDKLIPAFRRPLEANQQTTYWWPKEEKVKRLEFLNGLVNIYAKLVDRDLK